MTAAKDTHVLRLPPGVLSDFDVPVLVLCLMSRGRITLTGDMGRPQRDELAGLLEGSLLAELLRSGRPIRVDGVRNGYRIEEL